MPWYGYFSREEREREQWAVIDIAMYFTDEMIATVDNAIATGEDTTFLEEQPENETAVFLDRVLHKGAITSFSIEVDVTTARCLFIYSPNIDCCDQSTYRNKLGINRPPNSQFAYSNDQDISPFIFISNARTIRWLTGNEQGAARITEFEPPVNSLTAVYALIRFLEFNGVSIHSRKPLNPTKDSSHRQLQHPSNNQQQDPLFNQSAFHSYRQSHIVLHTPFVRNLLIAGTAPCLLDRIDRTVTSHGRLCLLKRLCSPADPVKNREQVLFTAAFQNSTRMKKLRTELGNLIAGIAMNDLKPGTLGGRFNSTLDNLKSNTLINSKSDTPGRLMNSALSDTINGRSIYSKPSLEETSISRYRKAIKEAVSMKRNQETFHRIHLLLEENENAIEESYISESNKENGRDDAREMSKGNSRESYIKESTRVPDSRSAHSTYREYKESKEYKDRSDSLCRSAIERMRELLANSRTTQQIDSKLAVVSTRTALPASCLADPTCFAVPPGVDQYLDITRRIYEEKIEECQNEALLVSRDLGLDIHLSDSKEICMKGFSTGVKAGDVNKKNSDGGNKGNRNERGNIRNKGNRSEKDSSNKTNSSNKMNRIVDNSINGDEGAANRKLFVIKETRHYKLYSTSRLKFMNKIIFDLFSQIMEIEGKICKEALQGLGKFSGHLRCLFETMGELDCLMSNALITGVQNINAACPIEGDMINTDRLVDRNSINTIANRAGLIDKNADKHGANTVTHGTDRSMEIPQAKFFDWSKIGNVLTMEQAQNYLIENSVRTSLSVPLGTLCLVTGENMSGKSSFIRNLGHVAVLARMGCPILCEFCEIPLFDQIYSISSLSDLNAFCIDFIKGEPFYNRELHNSQNLFNGDRSYTREEYKELHSKDEVRKTLVSYTSRKALVLVDELHCSLEVQRRLVKFLLKSRTLCFYVTHSPALIDYAASQGGRVFRLENFVLQEGRNERSSVGKICKKFIPELKMGV